MTTVAEFATSTYTFPAIDSVSFTMPNGSKALVRVNRGSASGPVAFQTVVATSKIIGPFSVGDVLTVFAQRGSCTYDVVSQEGDQYPYPAVSLTTADVAALKTQAGGVVAFSRATGGATGLIDVDGKPMARLNGSAGWTPRTSAEHSIFWNLNTSQNRNASPVYDASGTLRGKFKGGSTGKFLPDAGMGFNGTNHHIECNDSDSNAPQFSSFISPPNEGFTSAVKACSDLSTLASRGDMIIAYAVITHSSAGLSGDGIIASFGMNADPLGKGGWAFGIKSGAAGKMQVWHRGQGASTTDVQTLTASGITGLSNNNTKTAIALELTGIGDYIDVSGYMLTLDVDGDRSQNNVGMASIYTKANSGTQACGPDLTSPHNIGAWSDSVPISRLTPAGNIITTGAAPQLRLSASFGATGAGAANSGTIQPYTSGIWMWFGSQQGLTPKYYWVVFSNLTDGTIYSNGPGSAVQTGLTVGAITTPTANFVNFYKGSIVLVGIERRARSFGIGQRIVRDLRGNPTSFPVCLEGV